MSANSGKTAIVTCNVTDDEAVSIVLSQIGRITRSVFEKNG